MANNSSSQKRLAAAPLAVAWIACTLAAQGQSLFDGALGTLPSEQGWIFGGLGTSTQTLVDHAVQLDTSLATFTQAGYSRQSPSPLDRQNGFTLLFGAQVLAETHNNANRAGFSVLVLAVDKRGIELGFWTNLIFAQADSPLFTHAEEALFPVGTTVADYALTVLATNYVLRANGDVILSGPVRDYTAFSGLINPYRTPNFIFFGDDTTSASASAALRNVVLVPPPGLIMVDGTGLCWSGISNVTYSIEASTNLTDWLTVGSAVSPTSIVCFTNNPTLRQAFFRVVYP